MVIKPLEVPAGAVTITCVAVAEIIVPGTPLKRTPVVVPSAKPLIVTIVPAFSDVGAKLVNVGPAEYVYCPDVAVPPGVFAVIVPFTLTPSGTVVLIVVLSDESTVAVIPPNLTSDNPVKCVPVIVTGVPTPRVVGVKLVIVGAA